MQTTIGAHKMIDCRKASNLIKMYAIFAIIALVASAEFGGATDVRERSGFRRQSITIVSDGVVVASLSRSDGLEVSSDVPGMITITSGLNTVSVRSDYVTLSGTAGLAPTVTPGVIVTPNKQGGYTAALGTSDLDLGR